MIEHKEYFAKGKRGIASTALLNGKKVLVKEFNPKSDVNTIAHEAAILQMVNKKKIGPQFIKLEGGMLIREFIEGEEIVDWLGHAQKAACKTVLLDILEQCRTLDLLGINKLEMTHPHKHILVRKGKPIFIDFDRAKRTEKPKNVTQVLQWFTNKELSALLTAKKIQIDRTLMLNYAKSYKHDYGKATYERVREVILRA
jgi:putative serine/threonine protein kinase